ncbi:hypothetical protein A2U01_0058408 [Trifolium medium]|uniref:Uncharacterized protein n=1 Tax=Trifolium medium TaxID=97028 RepID=A0A392RM89_9FABA|nr:hypothetical protein [Trifolium medium]
MRAPVPRAACPAPHTTGSDKSTKRAQELRPEPSQLHRAQTTVCNPGFSDFRDRDFKAYSTILHLALNRWSSTTMLLSPSLNSPIQDTRTNSSPT